MSSGSILFVEDDPDDIQLTLMNLEPRLPGREFIIKRDGMEALEYLRQVAEASRPLPALMLMDLKMPRLNGLELMRLVRDDARLRDMPIVCLTSSGNERDKREALDCGARFYFEKPVDFTAYDEIAGALSSLLEKDESGQKHPRVRKSPKSRARASPRKGARFWRKPTTS